MNKVTKINIAAFLWEQRNAAQRNSRPELRSLINCNAQPERVNSLTLKQHPFSYCFANIDCSLREGRIDFLPPCSRRKLQIININNTMSVVLLISCFTNRYK